MTEHKVLPSELIDMIFDELQGNALRGVTRTDPAAKRILRNCLPVSTDFRHRILSRFCSDVSLFLEPADTGQVARLSKVISQPPNSRLGGIGRYIKHFTLHCRNIVDYDFNPEGLRDTGIFDSQDLVVILQGLHGEYFGVEEFSLVSSSSQIQNSVAWVDVPVGFRSAFQSLLQSPHLTRLDIKNISFKSESLFSGSHLKSLTIQASPYTLSAGPHQERYQDPLTASTLPFPALLELNIDHSHECTSNFLPASMLEKLEVFKEIPNSNLCSEKTWRVLGLSASSLTEIYISHTGAVVKPPKAFNLGIVHNLKVFEYSRRSTIDGWDRFDVSNDETPSILLQLFNTTKLMEYLKNIKIHFDLREIRFDFDLPENSIDEFFMDRTIADISWASLDRVLTGPHFPRLRHFEILISVAAVLHDLFDEQSFLNRTNDRLKSSFSRIVASETINFGSLVTVSRLPTVRSDFLNSSDEYSEEDVDSDEEGADSENDDVDSEEDVASEEEEDVDFDEEGADSEEDVASEEEEP